ncbi:MAG: hypothetical protein FJW63_08170, partial [Actinobacteria bacterium]|nr:hypothetical protein [Actinomycetota bacterium]
MDKNTPKYTAIFGNNAIEYLDLFFRGALCHRKMYIFRPLLATRLSSIFESKIITAKYLKKYIVKGSFLIGDKKGLWYKINQEAIDLTNSFYNKNLASNLTVKFYNRMFKTAKFEAYLKKEISKHIFAVMRQFYGAYFSDIGENVFIMVKSPLNIFIAKYLQEKGLTKGNIRMIRPFFLLMPFFLYYGWFMSEFLRRGISIRTARKKYKFSMEAVWSFKNLTLRNDIIIDGSKIIKKDVLFVQFVRGNGESDRSYNETVIRGYDTLSIPELKIRIGRYFPVIFLLYFFAPFISFVAAIFLRKIYLLHHLLKFYRECFPIELFMQHCLVAKNVSMCDHAEIGATIVMNRYGTKNVIFHWSDLTSFKDLLLAFIAHNEYMSWGDKHYSLHSDNYYVDRHLNIGCIYKEAFNRALAKKEEIAAGIKGLKVDYPKVIFFDTSFSNGCQYTENFYIRYLNMVEAFCLRHPEVNVLFKPKIGADTIEKSFEEHLEDYRREMMEMSNLDNFFYLDPSKWYFEKSLAICDACVSMGMNSPSTVALICGKNGLYYDDTGNLEHPFAKHYQNIIVFSDKELLFKQIDN